MRVIGGQFRSRRLKSIAGALTRPTPDRLRETLFDILTPQIVGATFLDAFAGTGAVGIEALSRGAEHAWFLERSRAALEVLKRNIRELALESRATVVSGSALLTLPRYGAEIVFLDPPYDQEGAYQQALEVLQEAAPQLVIAQHSVRLELPAEVGVFGSTRTVRQGDNVLTFYGVQDDVNRGNVRV
jgi:16S rRNA (guanine(966)-N(2))-methyltransferase RsmD